MLTVAENSFIPFFKDLLLKTVPQRTTPIDTSIPSSHLKDLGMGVGIESMRLYLINDTKHVTHVHHLYGDKDIWDRITLSTIREKLSRNQHTYRRFCFFSIRYFRENGRFLTLGYLVGFSRRKISTESLMGMNVYCILYGNYIVRRLVAGQYRQMGQVLSRIYEVANGEYLPGTKICRVQDNLFTFGRFNYGAYCSVCRDSVFVEYLCKNGHTRVQEKNIPIQTDTSFISNALGNNSGNPRPLSIIPKELARLLLSKDGRSRDYFSSEVIPVYSDNEVIGVWIFAYSRNNPYADLGVGRVLEIIHNSLNNSYKFIFQRRFKKMVINPIFRCRETRITAGNIFVIMPFTQAWSNEIWNEVLKPAISEIGMNPIRADDLYGQNIMEDVWQSILQSELIICDTTGRNPNVFYELGIAHTLGKKVILLTQNIDDIPFDLQSYRHIQYSPSISGGNQLKESLKRSIRESIG